MRILLLVALSLAACKSDPLQEDSPPPLGARIHDRVGRAAVSTALVGVVDARGEKNELQERYNRAPPETWPEYRGEIAKNLAIYDALDGTCGNQALAGGAAVPGRYAALASVLADDRLYVDTTSGECAQYLAVELAAAGDCGGRTPEHDVIDVTYSLLAAGTAAGVPDGVDADPEPPPSEFPYFSR